MKNLKRRIESLGLSYKKEMMFLGTINTIVLVTCILIIFLTKNIIYLAMGAIFLATTNYVFFYRYSKKELEIEQKLNDEFIEIFSYLRIYLYNEQNVYTSLCSIVEFASDKMKEKINVLIEEIDNDKSITPFINFSASFKNKTIEEVMISLYEITNCGNSNIYLNQFINIFENFKNTNETFRSNQRTKVFENINIFSIVGSGIIMLLIVYCVVGLLGDSANGF
ncbi:MAG TPA: hypothetical protein VJY64_01000 [Candidatus Onthovivens sp.]|nr:hypothetical protein [Candidatus Onthovivens sp.]